MFDFENSPWLAFRLGYVFHILILSCFSLWDLFKIIWIPPFSAGNLVTVTFIVVVIALIAMVLDIFKYYLDCFHEKRGTNRETMCRRYQQIGFGGVLMCGMATHLVVFYCKDYEQLVTIIFYVSAFSICLFKKFFLETPLYYVKSVRYGNRKKLLITSNVIYYLLLIVLLKTGIFASQAKNTNILFFGITSLTSSIELLMVMLEQFEMRTEQETARIIEKYEEPIPSVPSVPEEPSVPEDEKDQSFNDVFMYFYSILAVVVVILIILARLRTSIICHISMCLFFHWGRKFVERKMRERSDDELKFCHFRLILGFQGIIISWLVGQWQLYLASFELDQITDAILLPLIFGPFFYYQFIHGYRDTCNLNYNKFKLFTVKVVLFLFFIEMIVIRISISSENCYQNFQMGCIQFILFFMPLGSLPDLLVVMRGGVYLEGVETTQPAQVAIQMSPERRKVSPEIKCQACQEKYSEVSRIPRILKECGHTVCEPCADQRLNENRRSFLYCPVCRMATVVMGAASLLKKNWAVLEIMADN